MSEHQSETRALLHLSLCKGVGAHTVHELLSRHGSASRVLGAGQDTMALLGGISPAVLKALRTGPTDAVIERELDLMERFRVRLVPCFSDDYPQMLKALGPSAPPLLRVRGDYTRRDQLALGIVGARRCSVYGREQASRLGADLAGMGFTIVSGMARGIDQAAHRGALLAKGRTLAVFGCGLAHALTSGSETELIAEIASNGALISELPMSAPPRPENFPPRNRIISGLSLGVVIVEAALRSGSLITARMAGEQGRAVFAVPGPVNSATSRGTHALIRDGVQLVENAHQIVEGLGPLSQPIDLQPGDEAAGNEVNAIHDARVMALNERQKQVYALLEAQPHHVDDIVTRSDLPVSMISATLLTLEIRGLARRHSGQRYSTA
jgi:DNA processing protein